MFTFGEHLCIKSSARPPKDCNMKWQCAVGMNTPWASTRQGKQCAQKGNKTFTKLKNAALRAKKVKLDKCLISQARRSENLWRSEGIAPPLLTSALAGDEW
jgi:hypothetical protein